ncbi:hypothetical protein ABW20_dc0105109 [Dactylellina cionopaga]|nr:hypothetical protein ABW20_dc0105109 [Dactylellina cionopaga]
MSYNPHSHHADPASNVPLTYPEVVDPYAPKRPFPPSAFQSPALPQYNENSRRVSYELGSHEGSGLISPPLSSPAFSNSGHGGRPISYELVGSPPPGSNYPPSTMSVPVSELPAGDGEIRYSQASSHMRYSNQPGNPTTSNREGGGAGLGLSMPEPPSDKGGR